MIESKEAQRLGSRDNVRLDLRIVAATNRDLEQMTQTGRFRRDLFFRLNVHRIQLPPLRERKEDLRLLCSHFLRLLGEQLGLESAGLGVDLERALHDHDWPGNVRELKNVIECLLVNGSKQRLTCADLPDHFHCTADPASLEERDEAERLLRALSDIRIGTGRRRPSAFTGLG